MTRAGTRPQVRPINTFCDRGFQGPFTNHASNFVLITDFFVGEIIGEALIYRKQSRALKE